MPIKQTLLTAARWSGACAVARWGTRRRLRILAYHGVDEAENELLNFDGFHVAPAVFRSHMEALRRYRVRSLEETVAALREGRDLEDRTVCITFDDGYRNNLRQAAPILRAFGYPATFFVTTSYIEGASAPWWFAIRQAVALTKEDVLRPRALPALPTGNAAEKRAAILWLERHVKALSRRDRDPCLHWILEGAGLGLLPPYPMMNAEDVRELAAWGFGIGPHTVHHVALGAETKEAAEREVRESAESVFLWTGQRPKVFSYPYGRPEDIPAHVVEAVRGAGCLGAVTTSRGLNRRADDPFRLRRLSVTGHHSVAALDALMSGLR
jgi:peptidoglycan/xylan/chitin deacetylase (PgdA/CDA1 family)